MLCQPRSVSGAGELPLTKRQADCGVHDRWPHSAVGMHSAVDEPRRPGVNARKNRADRAQTHAGIPLTGRKCARFLRGRGPAEMLDVCAGQTL